MKLNKLLSICLGITLAFSVSANDLSEARIYINPGHGGWGPNDRPMATINYAQMDTLGFFETNTNLIKKRDFCGSTECFTLRPTTRQTTALFHVPTPTTKTLSTFWCFARKR